MKPDSVGDAILLAHMSECMARITNYTVGERARFEGSTLVQDAVIRNLQTHAESSQRLSASTKASEPGLPWRELSGFRKVVVHAYLAIDLAVVWSIVERDLPPLAEGVRRMQARLAR